MSQPLNAGRFPEPAAEAGSVIVAETGGDGFTQYLVNGRHQLLADEPVADGGADAGPAPYELMLMSLGACTSITLRMFARRRQWPLERVVIHLQHKKHHVEDCANCELETRSLDHIERQIELHGALSAEQKQRLMTLADHCPVHQTLTRGTTIVSRLITP